MPRHGRAVGRTLGRTLGTVRGDNYPLTAEAMRAACGGYGTWSAAWLCDEASGSLQPVFGTGTFAEVGGASTRIAGPLGGADRAVQALGTTSLDAGVVHDASATADTVVLLVSKLPAPGNYGAWARKSAADPAWLLYVNGTESLARMRVVTAGGVGYHAAVNLVADTWYVIVSTIDRGFGSIMTGGRSLAGVVASIAESAATVPAEAYGSGQQLQALAGSGTATVGPATAYMAIGVGVGAATGVAANIAAICASFSRSIGGL